MTAQTSEMLAKELDAVGLDRMAAKARADEYHDFLSPHDLPEMMLEADLRAMRDACPDQERKARIEAIRQRHLNGEFDANKEESDAWAASPEGQEAFAQLINRHKS